MKTGTAWRDITPSEPIPLGGQMHVRMGKYTHDPLTVNAVVFADGALRVGLVSCDLLGLEGDFVGTIKAACLEKYELNDVLVACTHTHVGPCTTAWLVGDVKPEFLDSVCAAIVDAVGEAIGNLEDTVLCAGAGHLEHMGWNRRGCGLRVKNGREKRCRERVGVLRDRPEGFADGTPLIARRSRWQKRKGVRGGLKG